MGIERSLNSCGDRAAAVPANIVRWIAATLFGLLGLTALLIVGRRLAGALEQPLEPAVLLAVGTFMALAAVGIRAGWRLRSVDELVSRSDWVGMVGVSLLVVSLGAALCTADTHSAGLIVFWLLLAVEETWAWRRYKGVGSLFSVNAANREMGSTLTTPEKRLPTPFIPPPEHVTQQLVRSRAADGADSLSGFVRILFLPGQRTANIHVAFCPPFTETPELTFEQLDGADVRIKTAQLLPYGARLDLKLATPAEQPEGMLLRFVAVGRARDESACKNAD